MNLSTFRFQQIVARIKTLAASELPILQQEKKRVQANESVRLEMSLSKEEMLILNRVREILGHLGPAMSTKELFVMVASVRSCVSAAANRFVFQRDRICQWKYLAEAGQSNFLWTRSSNLQLKNPTPRLGREDLG